MAAWIVRGMKGMTLSCTAPGSGEERAGVDGRGRPPSHQPPSPSKQKTRFQKGRRSYQSQSDPVNPLASTRYLLDGDEPFLEQFPDLDVLPAWRRIDSERFRSVTGDDSPSLKPSSSSSASSSFSSSVAAAPPVRCPTAEENDFAAGRTSPLGKSPEQRGPLLNESSPSPETTTTTTTTLPPTKETNSSTASREEQVVVLKVSLHCKGCAGKVRRHIARMEGVRTFNIEFDAKRVTVVGDVTPLGVLSSISKIKKAEFWVPA